MSISLPPPSSSLLPPRATWRITAHSQHYNNTPCLLSTSTFFSNSINSPIRRNRKYNLCGRVCRCRPRVRTHTRVHAISRGLEGAPRSLPLTYLFYIFYKEFSLKSSLSARESGGVRLKSLNTYDFHNSWISSMIERVLKWILGFTLPWQINGCIKWIKPLL